jgi:hypothetical protein
MAKPWEKDEIVATASPWERDALVDSAKAPDDPVRIPLGAGGPETVARALLPRSFKAAEADAGVLRQAGAGALDALSAPGRAVAAVVDKPIAPFAYAGAPNAPKIGDPGSFTAEGGRQFANSMAATEGQNLPGKIIRDPALLPSLATGGAAGALVRSAGLTGLGAASAIGGLMGAESGAIHQTDNAVQGKEVSPLSALGEAAAGAALPVVAKGVGMAVHGGNKLLGRLAQEFSGVSEEALRTHGAGFGQGAKDLAAAAGKQHEIGQKLVKVLDNLDDYLPEKHLVDQALHEMPPVPVTNTIKVLEQAKTGGVLSSSRAVNDKIDGLISDLTNKADQDGNIAAPVFRQIRKEIDGLIGDSFGKESGAYVNALKQSRYQMADDLVKSAESSGNPDYVDAMKSMSQKLQVADKLKSFLGKSAQTRDTRAESFVSTLFGKNKTDRQEAVKAMEQLFGGDFTAEAKLANLAAELGPEGKAGLLPRQFTGRAALGPTVAALGGHFVNPVAGAPALALSSPRLAAGMLSGADAVDRFVNSSVSAMERIGTKPALVAPASPSPELQSNLEALQQPLNLNTSDAPLGRRVIPQALQRRPLNPPPPAPTPPTEGLPPRVSSLQIQRRPLGALNPEMDVGALGDIRAAEADRLLAPLAPRRPVGNIPSNFPPTPQEPEAMRRVLDNAGRAELPNQAAQRITEALKTATGQERLRLIYELQNAIKGMK